MHNHVLLCCFIIDGNVCTVTYLCINSEYLLCSYSEAGYNDLYEYFLRGKESLRIDRKVQKVTGLNREQVSIISYCIQSCSSCIIRFWPWSI